MPTGRSALAFGAATGHGRDMTDARTSAPVIVGVDGSAESARAARWAVAEAERRGVDAVAVLVWSYLDQPSEVFDPGFTEDDAHAALLQFLDAAVGAGVASTIEPRVVCDLPSRGLLEAANDARLLVVGARGAGGFAGLRLGSVADRVAQRSPTPAVIVCGDGTPGGPVVVGYDGSSTSKAALEWSADEARLAGVPLQVVRAWEPPALIDWTFLPDAPVVEKMRAEMEAETADAVAEVSVDIAVSTSYVSGSPASDLVELSATASMVVVGRRGLGGLAAVTLGSVSRQVVHHATCPVVVVPPVD
jgi:nucleotide-binding universal stress UspA family protein